MNSEELLDFAIAALWSALFVAMFVGTIAMLYHGIIDFGSIRPERRWVAPLLGPFVLLFPSLFDEVGQKHMPRLFLALALLILMWLAVFTLKGVQSAEPTPSGFIMPHAAVAAAADEFERRNVNTKDEPLAEVALRCCSQDFRWKPDALDTAPEIKASDAKSEPSDYMICWHSRRPGMRGGGVCVDVDAISAQILNVVGGR